MAKNFSFVVGASPSTTPLLIRLLLVGFISFVPATLAVDLSQCIAPLGMESGAIPDKDITVSSTYDAGNVGPHLARLKTESLGGAWCPKNQITKEAKEWLEIDLHTVHLITATATQGRFGNGQGVEYSEAYLLEYWRPRLGKWVRYRDIKGQEVIPGNTNTYLESKHELEPPLWASKIRFLPFSRHTRTVCMRVELYGCYWSDGVVSYSMPQGDKRGNEWEFFDATYDGHWDDELRRGLGQLTDGKTGPDDFKMGYYDDRGQGWVGWRNDTRSDQPIEIKFEFDVVREFSAIHIYCNNQFTRDVQIFSQVDILFSIGGRYYNGEPITYTYMEDKIFETSRNVTIKLHHRIGKYVKLRLHFSARWIMISEVIFDSDVAHGNFTTEEPPTTESPIQSDVFVEKNGSGVDGELPVSTAKHDDPTYMAIVIGVLMAVILLLAVAIFLIVSRHRQRKCFASPMTGKAPSHLGSTCATVEKGAALMAYTLEDDERYAGGSLPTLPRDLGNRLLDIAKLDDYQEPYQALKYAPYYSYSTVVMEMKDMMLNNKGTNINHSAVYANGAVDTSYDYAVPELGTVPLLNQEGTGGCARTTTVSSTTSDKDSLFSKNSSHSTKTEDKKSPTQQEVLSALKRRLEQTSVPLFPRHRLRMLSKLAEGAFGTVYVAEAEGIPEYGTTTTLGKRFVAVKFLLPEASEKEKLDFQRDVRILAALEDRNIARVLGACCREEPYCVVMEYLEHGDLCQFLKTHITAEDAHSMPIGVKTLSFNCLIYMAAQIASGMRYLENLNFVHRDLATRNCLVGKAYHIKISDFGTDNELYACDYYKVDGTVPLPVRWMAWESIFLGKYTTKSDVWAFAVTLWEILNLGRRIPYEHLSNEEVVESLRRFHRANEEDGSASESGCTDGTNDHFDYLPRPTASSKDIYDLMLECWRREENERPTFREISLFLQRKNLGYAPTS
ncbi:discoidin domain-containing receptor 2-like isoform X2 [Vespa mandarinia]|uniref:discoidin domain-containing receptor 2-like n=1 Tax=Vespa velutina TaxID=202808 RepID=UPI001608ACE0|nr:discoidin domain-containing receptor 2-like isoform X2 [Vespa mandarinia]XP_047359192.1 discoidin domain-containing receptor 2-like [Vespa velutina]XP_047359193.1 discoidin domain-containing receptor 2-like [Vespa velutina]XP_047359194.1 discoidin domain-containing receptor 2-like [Vespa velutina]XP_047359195.1 discoidin domain-containing receptor 2-like [Vespa velutina]XP_047359196.1 discoidin domain-containing receptor 2-like [Vespa velutina]XP_047359197.1 discoidin domain-containing rec